MQERDLAKTRSLNPVPPVGRDGDAGSEDLSLHALMENGIRVLRRRVKLAVAVFLLFVIPASVFIVRRPFTYQATARIVVEASPEANLVLAQGRGGDPVVDEVRTQSQLLRSRPIVAKTVEQVKLWDAREFNASAPTAAWPAEKVAADLIDPFLSRLTIWQEPGAGVLNVTFAASDAALTSRAVNTLIQVYIDEQTRAQFAASAEIVDWLQARLDEQEARLKQSEAALHAFMETENAISVQERQNIVVQKLGDLNAAVTRAKTERLTKETQYERLRSVGDPSAVIETLPAALSNGVLQGLRSQLGELKQKELVLTQDLGDRHPEIVKLRSEIALTEDRLRTELTKTIDVVKNDFSAAQALEQSLVSALDQQKQEVLDLNRKSLEYGALQRQATSDREIYERLLSETQTRGIAGKTPATRVRIIESAEVPRIPVAPHRRRDLLLAMVGGLLLALSAPVARESLDRNVKTPSDIEHKLGLRCLAIVPLADGPSSGAGPLLTNHVNPFNEAFRRLRIAMTLDARAQGAARVVVASAGPREGKTLVSVNLAMALAQMDGKVLLIDGDLRRPKVHKMLDVAPFPGFADLLSGQASMSEAIRPTHLPNLFVLPCGMRHADTFELLSSARFDRLLEQLGDSFAWIVFDSPPIGSVSDAAVIGQCAHYAVLVVAADATPVNAARAAVEQIASAGVSMSGAILNRADLKRAGYYYGATYSTEYVA